MIDADFIDAVTVIDGFEMVLLNKTSMMRILEGSKHL